MAQGEFDTLYFIFAGVGRGATIFSFDNSTSLGGGGRGKNPEMVRGCFQKIKGKNREIIIAHPLDIL